MQTITTHLASSLICLTSVVMTAASAQAFIPSTLFSLSINTSIEYNPASKDFTYRYSLTNAATSQQSVADFGISYESDTIKNATSPPNWEPSTNFGGKNALIWYYVGESEAPIPPGTTKSGFSFQSPNLPSLSSTYYARSSFEYFAKTDQEVQEIKEKRLTNFFNNSQKGAVPGPGPRLTTPSQVLSHIIRTKHDAYDRGLITSSGLVIALDKKLEAAEASLSRGQKVAAINQIGAFINQLNAQRDNQVKSSAYFALQSNASYLLDLLK